MLATLVEPFDRDGWLFEIKWDGYRAVAMMHNGKVDLRSRNNNSFNEKYPPVFEALQSWGIDAIIDGEIVALNKDGKPDFGTLQNWQNNCEGDILYYVFDLLWMNGVDLTRVPLEQRRDLLQELMKQAPDDIIRFSQNFESTATELLEAVGKMGMEGIIAKKKHSAYFPGQRSEEWVKMKRQQRQEVVIGGYILLDSSPKPFSSLLAGVYDNGIFRYAGKIGTGFSIATQKEMLRKFQPLIRKTNPFDKLPDFSQPAHFMARPARLTVTFLEPELVCEVKYTELTLDRIMRHPSFVAMREDKRAEEVVQEIAVLLEEKASSGSQKNNIMAADHSTNNLLPASGEETQERKFGKIMLQFTNLDKLYWPEDGITKRDLLNYYHQAAPYILPYIKNRPMSLNRHPDGFAGFSFYQKDVTGKVPDWVETMPYRSEEEPDIDKAFMVATNEASLLYMANLGCIEINPWNSTVKNPENPDWCVLDLDPDKKNTFDQVIEVALAIYDLLKSAEIPSFCKTSGSTGLHIYIPLGAKYTYDQSKEFARILVTLVQRQLPQLTSIERKLSDRKGKIYLDFLQNRHQATLAAPYSVRPKPHAPVSMPLHWTDVKKGLKITDFTIKNAISIMESQDGFFKGVLGKGIDMVETIGKMEAL